VTGVVTNRPFNEFTNGNVCLGETNLITDMTDQPDLSSAATDGSPTPLPHEQSIYARKFNITSFQHDPKRWNRDWEKVLHTLSSEDVYTTIGGNVSQLCLSVPDEIPRLCQDLKAGVLHLQSGLTKLWDDLLGEKFESFRTAWFLLDDNERTRYLLKGLEETIRRAVFGQDLRALCPEITVSAMLKGNGRPYTDFLTTYQMKIREMAVGQLYLVPSEWWNKAQQDIPQSLSETISPSVFEILTLLRNQFISESPSNTLIHQF
jgi:hypothetical protein